MHRKGSRLWRILRSIYNRYLKLLSYIWMQRFLISIWLSGGNAVIGQKVKVNHKVIFQGKGQVNLGDNVLLGYGLSGSLAQPILLQPREKNAVIEIGSQSAITNGCELIARQRIKIGENCLIGPGSLIMDSDFHDIRPDFRHTSGASSPITIGDNVWIGARCIILKGITIERDAVIAAGSVVYKNVGPGEILSSNTQHIIGNVYEWNANQGIDD
jgi:acetyltransferase-like isoleucine patch superfamily enzyme